MMCNQCNDARRIHGNVQIWIVKQDGRSVLQMTSKARAERGASILKLNFPDSEFEIVEENNRNTKWD